MKYTVDSIEGNLVILLERENENNKRDVPLKLFPAGIKDGDIVQELQHNDGIRYIILEEETQTAKDEATALLNKILNKNKK